MLAVVLRYGMGRRHQMGSRTVVQVQDGDGIDARSGVEPVVEPDGVEAMVAGVKSRGVSVYPDYQHLPFPNLSNHQGRELLRYVRGLLG